MLGFFPHMYKDELLYSALARFHQRSGSNSYKDTIMNLYENRTTSAITDFPSSLDLLGKKINQEPNSLIYEHTLFPYYEPYISENVAEKIVEQMIYGDANSISLALGLAASKVKGPDHFRYCLRCYLEELDLYGEAYWHRIHQLPGVYVCPSHKESLWISDVPFRNKTNKHRFFSLQKSCVDSGQEMNIPEEFYENLVYIAEQSYALLNSKFAILGLKNINQFYLAKLNEKHYITPSKRIRIQELIPDFLDSFPMGFLKFLNSDFEYFDEDTWFHKVVRKPKVACHPLRHLFFLLFLGQRIGDQISENHHKVHFFGRTSWPCLNKAATHYKEFLITDCIVTRDYKTGKPVGTFTCKDCGFTYSRTGPDASEKDKYRIGRIKNFGPVWQNKLDELYTSGMYSIRGISSMLGVDSKTTKKYLTNDVKNIPSTSNEGEQNTFEEKRKMFMELRKRYPNFSRSELRKSSPRLYNWLYKNDREWFTSNLPHVKRRQISRTIVDWEERDDEYSLLIIREAIILSLEIPLVRVTKTRIYQRLDVQTRFENNLDKLPKCKNILQDVTETVQEFQIRKIRYFGDQFRRKNMDISISTLTRTVGIKKISNDFVQQVILDEMNMQGDE
ncbi:TnsD family Tn7-like transposition protein [Bacillus sp. FJAT-50079]|uniref:TnsD family Tn7-like transposition protein n=1 Tax=Bacillus sp. FJAT-50079 TaxID=2833577 RepID=UPI001BC8E15C|nr:TnsD family Tn7-like transposition protein [Bacillus sp. FJAT-50079]MBS4207193.1 TnsD family transposase [Bacillus sp. FJAT-50079]